MISSTVARSYTGSPLIDLVLVRVRAMRKVLQTRFAQWRERSIGRSELMKLTERDLRDIGITRSEAKAEASKQFWEAWSGDYAAAVATLSTTPPLIRGPCVRQHDRSWACSFHRGRVSISLAVDLRCNVGSLRGPRRFSHSQQISIVIENKQTNRGRQVGVFALGIDRRNQIGHGNAALICNVFERCPKRAFKAHAGFVTPDYDWVFHDKGLHGCHTLVTFLWFWL
jgi:uncharacterized protein YjiS (DUF1127 family)